MAKKFIYLIGLSAIMCLFACSEDDLDSKSIFDTSTAARNELDTWILNNYINVYNIDIKYRLEDIETDMKYNLIPADYDKSFVLSQLIRYLWIDAYNELMGDQDFIKKYSPKLLNYVGSKAYNIGSNSVVLGTAEGGVKITLYNVNELDDITDIDFLNYWFFKTMHHEFAHILHQTKNYTTDFNTISAGLYEPTNWVNRKEIEALQLGFVSPYASSETQEDFVETIAVFVTNTESYWEQMIRTAGSNGGPIIEEKLEFVKNYLANSWDIDIYELREIVQRRTANLDSLELETL